MPRFIRNKAYHLQPRLGTPAKIQDFLNRLPFNFEKKGETCYSPAMVWKYNTAHCMEGAMFAAFALRKLGHPPLVVDLRATKKDFDHVVAVFKINTKWGAISKTNHAVLRYREPVYRDIRELVMSYFHEYFLDSGRKTLRQYSDPFDLSRFDKKNWMTSEKNLFYIPEALDHAYHHNILTPRQIKNLRAADKIEISAGKMTQ